MNKAAHQGILNGQFVDVERNVKIMKDEMKAMQWGVETVKDGRKTMQKEMQSLKDRMESMDQALQGRTLKQQNDVDGLRDQYRDQTASINQHR